MTKDLFQIAVLLTQLATLPDKAAPCYWFAGAGTISAIAKVLVYRGIVKERGAAA